MREAAHRASMLRRGIIRSAALSASPTGPWARQSVNSLSNQVGGQNGTHVAPRSLRGRTERRLQCGKANSQGAPENGEERQLTRAGPRLRKPPQADRGSGRPLGGNLPRARGVAWQKEVQGHGRRARGG